MKILVTGGAGFIGSHVAEALLRRGDEVVIVDDLNDFYAPALKKRNLAHLSKHGAPAFYQGDIRDAEFLRGVFEAESPGSVIHLAARAGVRPSLAAPILYEEVNVIGTLNLLDLCRSRGVSNFIFASSSSVYGINSKLPFSESDPIEKPVSPYATTKRAGELVCFNYSHLYQVPVTCLRFFTVYGPRQRPEMAIHKFTRSIFSGTPIDIFAGGASSRDYTYVGDIVGGVIAAHDKPQPFKIYNLGNSAPINLTDLVTKLENAIGKKAERRILPDQPGDVPATYADITLARSELGFNPTTTLDQGLHDFVLWYRSVLSSNA